MNDSKTDDTDRCQSRQHNGEQCELEAEEYIDYDTPRGDIETYVYCSEHADHYAEKASTSVLGRGVIVE